MAIVRAEGLSQHSPVVFQHRSITLTKPLQKRRRALDVGEEKSDGSARESGHARSVLPNPGNAESVPGQSEQVRTTLLTHARTMAVLASI